MYKAFIEPDLQTAHIKIINKFNPFTGFQSPTYILKVNIRVCIQNFLLFFFITCIFLWYFSSNLALTAFFYCSQPEQLQLNKSSL